MTVVTRSQANQFREKEFRILGNIDINIDDDPVVHVTRSATGQGVHIRWIYPEAHNDTGPREPSDPGTPHQKSPSTCRTAKSDSQGEPYRPPTPYEHGEGRYTTPGPLPRTTPLAPKAPSRTLSTGVTSDMDMMFRVHIQKDENIEKALWRHIEMYMEESRRRTLENQRRVYEFVQTQPHLLREVIEETELFVRDDPSWDDDPFQ